MTAENIYLYLFLVGVFFTVGNLAISGVSHLFGGLGGGAETDGSGAIEMDGGGAELGDAGGIDGGGGFDGAGGIDGGGGFDGAGGGLDGSGGFDGAGGGSGGSFDGLETGAGQAADMGFDSGDGIDIGAAAVNLGVTTDISLDADGAPDLDMPVNALRGAGTQPGGHHGAHDGDSAGDGAGKGALVSERRGYGGAKQSAGGFNLLSFMTAWLPIRPTALICFSTVTGGLGSIFLRLGWADILTHVCSIASGYGLSMLLGVALPKKLRRAQNTSAAERYELIGLPAQVTSAIVEGGFGRIAYVVRDNAQSAPARHIDGKRVPQGARVVICEIKSNVFYVTELNI
ncbi:MAG: hypothetical protein FWH01_01420 [Oscillospiraceae bacterium]|nr:hypothetical protein [Oscillospiraceae bacterium]